jgi:hypothetical protein
MQTIQQGKVWKNKIKTLSYFVNDSKDSRNQFQIIINFLLIHFFSTTRIILEFAPNLITVSIPVF